MKALSYALLLAFAAASCGSDDPTALLASAKDYMAKRDFNASAIQLKNLLQKEPDNAEARLLLGLSALESGDVVAAEVELGKATKLGLKSDELAVALARLSLAKGEPGKVIAQFEGTQLRSPQHQAELHALLGTAQLARNDRREAQGAFSEALKLDAANATAHLGMAWVSVLDRDLPAALSHLEQALKRAPARAEALLLKADLLAAQGEAHSAEQVYREATRVSPHAVAPRLRLITHVAKSSIETAWRELEEFERVAAKDPRVSYMRAVLLAEERKFAAAKEAILPMLKVAPNHVPSLTLAGLAAYQTGAYAEAESHLRKALFNAPNALAAKRLLAATHLRMGKTEVALAEVGDLLTRAGQDPAVLALAGEAHLANGDVKSAQHYYQQAKTMQPDRVVLQARLAQIRFAAGDADTGMRELEAASAADSNAYQADLALIAAHLRRREPDRALKAIRAMEKKQPDNPLTYHLRGLALIMKRDFAGARASFERSLKLRPHYMPAVANLARLDLRDKKPETAKSRYQGVLKAEPNNEQALFGLAAILRITGTEAREIEKLLKHAVASNLHSANARVSLITFYLRNRDAKSALGAAQEAQAALPNDPAVVQALAIAQLAAGDQRQAIASFTRLTELVPKSPEPYIHLARAHLAAKQPDDSIRALRAALALRPELANVQRDIASIYVTEGRSDEAVREAREVQKKHADNPFGYMLEAEIYVAQKKWDLAEKVYRSTLKKFDLPLVMARTHAVIEAAGKPAEADALAQNWIKAHPQDTSVLVHLGDRDLAARRYDEAVEHYRQALRRQPDHPLVLNNLAWASNELKRPEALEQAERAHELAPEHAGIMDTLGWILTQRGENERGLELLARAAELAPNAYGIRLHFAKALLKAKKSAAARQELEALAKLDQRLPVQKEAASLLKGL